MQIDETCISKEFCTLILITAIFMMVSLSSFGQANQNNMNATTKTGYKPVNGLKMYYEIYTPSGQKCDNSEPLVLIHGGGSTIESTFGNILPLLSPDFEVIAVEFASTWTYQRQEFT